MSKTRTKTKTATKPAPRRPLTVPTVGDRVRLAHQALVLANEAIRHHENATEHVEIDPTVAKALDGLLADGANAAFWLSRLPQDVLDRPAPDGDQLDVMAGAR